LIRKTVPGHDLDDVDDATGEPRRIVYHWPNVYTDPSASNDDDSTPIEATVAGGYTNGHHSQPAVRATSSDAPSAHIAATRGG
jgi:hypothetical protein